VQFCRSPFDLVITDLEMPVMDGRTLISKIKARSVGTPVIIITGQGAPTASRLDGLKAAGALLYKPFPLHHLLTAMQTLLPAAPLARHD
jgi:DNA-binding response OmpR family regulator